MKIKTDFNKNFGKWFVNDVLKAIRNYNLIALDEKVCVAISGGKDSITLLYILWFINRYSHFKFDISAVHIKTYDYNTDVLHYLCEELTIPYFEDKLIQKQTTPKTKRCSICSHLKHGGISKLLENHCIQKVAYGHHADDVAETFFMNIVKNRKLGSFSPKVEVTDYPVTMIRPMIYLEETQIKRIHEFVGLPILSYNCPYEKDNIRVKFKHYILKMNSLFRTKNFSKKLVESLENIDYTNIWHKNETG